MDITIPSIPAGVLTLLAFFAPYAVGLLNGILPFVRTTAQKRLVAIVVAIVLAAVVIIVYQAVTGQPIGDPWLFGLLSIVVIQASYALVTRDLGAKQIERATNTTPQTSTPLPDPSVSTRATSQDALDAAEGEQRDRDR